MKREKKLTRRETLKLSGTLAAGSLLAACAPAAASTPVSPAVAPAPTPAPAVAKETYAVVSPVGESTAKMITMVPRLNTLEGKTICLTWNGMFKGEVTLPIIAELLKKKYPTAKVIPYTDMPRESGWLPWPEKAQEELAALYKAKGVQAVIAGNGG